MRSDPALLTVPDQPRRTELLFTRDLLGPDPTAERIGLLELSGKCNTAVRIEDLNELPSPPPTGKL